MACSTSKLKHSSQQQVSESYDARAHKWSRYTHTLTTWLSQCTYVSPYLSLTHSRYLLRWLANTSTARPNQLVTLVRTVLSVHRQQKSEVLVFNGIDGTSRSDTATMASNTQGIQQLLSAEKKAAEKVGEARKRK